MTPTCQVRNASPRGVVRWLVVAIGVVTLALGLAQLALPERTLVVLGLASSPATAAMFRLASLLSASLGAALVHAMVRREGERVLALWTGVAKVSAASIVALSAGRLELAAAALFAAGYDGAAGAFLVWFAAGLRRRTSDR